MTGIKPVGHRLLVLPDSVEEVSEGGIVMVTNEKQKQLEQRAVNRGTVVEIGSQCWVEIGDGSKWAEIGDKVVYARHSGNPIRENEEDQYEYLLINDTDVIAVITESN